MTINKWSTRLPAAAGAPAAHAVAAAFLKAHSGGWRNLISHNIMKRECSALCHSRQCWTKPGRDVELYVKCVCVCVCLAQDAVPICIIGKKSAKLYYCTKVTHTYAHKGIQIRIHITTRTHTTPRFQNTHMYIIYIYIYIVGIYVCRDKLHTLKNTHVTHIH